MATFGSCLSRRKKKKKKSFALYTPHIFAQFSLNCGEIKTTSFNKEVFVVFFLKGEERQMSKSVDGLHQNTEINTTDINYIMK